MARIQDFWRIKAIEKNFKPGKVKALLQPRLIFFTINNANSDIW
jgi:hypothetical protein